MPGGWRSWAATAAIIGSLAIKLALLDMTVSEDWRDAVDDLEAALAHQGYAVAVPRADVPAVRAAQAGCVLVVRLLDPYATFRDTELAKLPPGWTVAYAWRDSWQSSLPRLGPLAEFYLGREIARIGSTASRAPVLMLSVSPRCGRPNASGLNIRVDLKRMTAGS